MDFPKSVPSAGLVNGRFVDEDQLAGTPGSLIPSAWGNAITLEVLNAIAASGQEPAEANLTQLWTAIKRSGLAYGIGSIDGGPRINDANGLTATGVYSVAGSWTGSVFPGVDPLNQGSIFHRSPFETSEYEVQTFQSMIGDVFAFRRKEAAVWKPWRVVYHAGNLPAATTAASGVMRFSTQPEVSGGADNNSAVTPLTLKNRLDALLVNATTAVAGFLRLSTGQEVTDGANNNSAVTPLTLKNRLDVLLKGATEGVAGFIKIATNDVMSGLTNNSDAVTVAKLRLGFSMLGAANGYIVLPVWLGGLIFQWGESIHTGSDTKVTSLPMAFPTGVMKAIGGTLTNSSVGPQGIVKTIGLNQITTYSTGGYNVSWFAIGW